VAEWWQKIPKNAILTPHPGEMSRLTGTPLTEIQQKRFEIAQKSAREWQKTVVLKGAYTIIASPEGETRISEFANPGLASAGTGDVLAGVISGLIAQGLTPFNAAVCGAYLHGLAAQIVSHELGDAGMLAGDLLPVLPRALKMLKQTE
jgi:hydroxyethylthiazole kinase-like uncharacterized protein yjeF